MLAADESSLNGFCFQLFQRDSRAVIGDLNVHLPALVIGAHPQRTLRGFPIGDAHGDGLDAVIYGIPDDVSEWILDRLDDGLIEFCVTALHFDAYLFSAGTRQVPYHPWELAPNIPDGLHAGLHRAALQLGGNQVQALCGPEKSSIRMLAGELQDLVARQHELADEVYQFIEQGHIHSDAAVGCCGRL